jgi:signal transduction histidine kinase
MASKSIVMDEVADRPSPYNREVLTEQLLWFVRLRWAAAGSIVVAAVVASYVFPVLVSAVPIYICALILLLCNTFYFLAATKQSKEAGRKDILLGMVQAEADLVILTAVLHFSGGVVNPFVLFYIFHVIISTIILPRNLSFAVGLTAILLFGLLAVNELNGGVLLGYYPLQLSVTEGLWRNPVYVLGAFVAFICTVVLAQYLTRMIIVRMTAKEREAARNNDVLQAVISAMSEGLVFINCDGDITICNPAAKLWKLVNNRNNNGIPLKEFPPVLAGHIKSFFTDDDESASKGRVISFEAAGSERRYIEARSCPVVGIDGQKLGCLIVGQDLTDRKKLEKDLVERTEALTAINEMLKMSRIKMAQREKMVAIGQMAAGIAHEIGNPLASLSSVTQYLRRRLSTHEEKEHLLVIEHQVNRISNILKRMLSLSRPAAAEYKWVDINGLIDDTISLVKFDNRMRSVNIKNIPCESLPMVWLSPQTFEQVFINVFINAMDAMNAVQDHREHVLKITRELKDEMVEIRISDTGVGMTPEVCKLAFDSFFTTKEIGKGTGLGLFISYNLIAEVGGTIALESELGKGTTVIIRVPIRPQGALFSGTEENFVNGERVAKK